MHSTGTKTRTAASLIGGVAMLLLTQGNAIAGTTPWFNRDAPSGVGDYEDTINLLKVTCRIRTPGPDMGKLVTGGYSATGQTTTDGKIGTALNPGYHCGSPHGGYCKNADQTAAGKPPCEDMEVQYSW